MKRRRKKKLQQIIREAVTHKRMLEYMLGIVWRIVSEITGNYNRKTMALNDTQYSHEPEWKKNQSNREKKKVNLEVGTNKSKKIHSERMKCCNVVKKWNETEHRHE